MSSSEPSPDGRQRWRLDIAYDGSGLRGFAYQPEALTVVGLLRETLSRTLRLAEAPMIVGAGRTDAGVHAFGQVVHVDLADPLFPDDRGPDADRLIASINAQLAGRVRVLRARRVGRDFHARHSALWRQYRYLVLEQTPAPLALSRTWSWAVPVSLDVAAMNVAAGGAVGEHDFRAFCRRPAETGPEEPITRRVLFARWERVSDEMALSPGASTALRLDIRAQAFCHHMVRCLVSTMVAIGRGTMAESIVADRLASPRREGLPPPAPAAGLALIEVGYPEAVGA